MRPGKASTDEAIGTHSSQTHAVSECAGLVGDNVEIVVAFSVEAGNFIGESRWTEKKLVNSFLQV